MKTKEQLIFYYQLLRKYGLNDSHSGNASIRDNDNFIITKSGACADLIESADLLECAINSIKTPSVKSTQPIRPSLDTGIHQSIYQRYPEFNAVLHAHNPYTIAQTFNGSYFSPLDFEGQLYFGDLDIIECDTNNYLETMPQRISDALQNNKLVIVRTHGVYVGAETAELAYKWLCSLEQSAKIKWLAKGA